MATYVIGDIQGCFIPFIHLLKEVNFNFSKDYLWLTGDLVNRGPASLEVLRFIKSMKYTEIVLGNHDLHLLSLLYGKGKLHVKDTLTPILKALDKEELAEWLRHKSLLHYDRNFGVLLVHAGLPPQWDLNKALKCANEVEAVLRSKHYTEFFINMYGNKPTQWNESLTKWDRLRVIVNCLTRLRFCDINGNLDLDNKSNIPKKNFFPWFKVPGRKSKDLKIIFGHWSTLNGKTNDPNSIALDTGCVWGKCLTAIRLEDKKFFFVKCL